MQSKPETTTLKTKLQIYWFPAAVIIFIVYSGFLKAFSLNLKYNEPGNGCKILLESSSKALLPFSIIGIIIFMIVYCTILYKITQKYEKQYKIILPDLTLITILAMISWTMLVQSIVLVAALYIIYLIPIMIIYITISLSFHIFKNKQNKNQILGLFFAHLTLLIFAAGTALIIFDTGEIHIC